MSKLKVLSLAILFSGILFFTHYGEHLQKSCLHHNFICGMDMDQYMDYSDNIMAGNGFSVTKVSNMYGLGYQGVEEPIPDILRLPAYSYFLSLIRLIHNHPESILVSNVALHWGTMMYTMLIMSLFLGFFTTLIFGGLMLFEDEFALWVTMGNADLFCSFLVVGAIFHLLKSQKSEAFSKSHLAIFTVFASIAALSRQNTFILVMFPFLAISLFNLKNWKPIAITTGVIGAILGFWMIRNSVVSDSWPPFLSALKGTQLYVHFADRSHKWYDLYVFRSYYSGDQHLVAKYMNEGMTVQAAWRATDTYLFEQTMHWIWQFPSEVYRITKEAIEFMTIQSIFSNFFFKNLNLVEFGKVFKPYTNYSMAFGALGYVFFIHKYKDFRIFLISMGATVLLFILMSAFFHGLIIKTRGLMPVMPFLFLFWGIWTENLVVQGSKLVKKLLPEKKIAA